MASKRYVQLKAKLTLLEAKMMTLEGLCITVRVPMEDLESRYLKCRDLFTETVHFNRMVDDSTCSLVDKMELMEDILSIHTRIANCLDSLRRISLRYTSLGGRHLSAAS